MDGCLHWYATGTDIDDRKRAEQSAQNENQALRDEIDHSSMFEEIVGSSAPLRHVLAQVARVAGADATVLILVDGYGQGAHRAGDSQELQAFEPGIHPRELRRHSSHAHSHPSCSATRKDPSPARCSAGSGVSKQLRAEPSSSTSRRAAVRSPVSLLGCCRKESSSGSESNRPLPWTSASWPQAIAT